MDMKKMRLNEGALTGDSLKNALIKAAKEANQVREDGLPTPEFVDTMLATKLTVEPGYMFIPLQDNYTMEDLLEVCNDAVDRYYEWKDKQHECFDGYMYENKNTKNVVKLDESKLRNIIKESIKNVLKENEDYEIDDDDIRYADEVDGNPDLMLGHLLGKLERRGSKRKKRNNESLQESRLKSIINSSIKKVLKENAGDETIGSQVIDCLNSANNPRTRQFRLGNVAALFQQAMVKCGVDDNTYVNVNRLVLQWLGCNAGN